MSIKNNEFPVSALLRQKKFQPTSKLDKLIAQFPTLESIATERDKILAKQSNLPSVSRQQLLSLFELLNTTENGGVEQQQNEGEIVSDSNVTTSK